MSKPIFREMLNKVGRLHIGIFKYGPNTTPFLQLDGRKIVIKEYEFQNA